MSINCFYSSRKVVMHNMIKLQNIRGGTFQNGFARKFEVNYFRCVVGINIVVLGKQTLQK